MAACRVTCSDGWAVEVDGDLEMVIGELHKVATRREHSFAIFTDVRGAPFAVRPEAVLHVRPVDPAGEPSSA